MNNRKWLTLWDTLYISIRPAYRLVCCLITLLRVVYLAVGLGLGSDLMYQNIIVY